MGSEKEALEQLCCLADEKIRELKRELESMKVTASFWKDRAENREREIRQVEAANDYNATKYHECKGLLWACEEAFAHIKENLNVTLRPSSIPIDTDSIVLSDPHVSIGGLREAIDKMVNKRGDR